MTDIWTKFSFNNAEEKSALDYLNKFKEGLIKQTGGVLKLDVEAVDSFLATDPPRPAAIYTMYVVAPRLGNFRRKVLTVAEYSDIGRFPVDIVAGFTELKKIDVSEIDFENAIAEILALPIIKHSIETLYKQSVNLKE
jgi:hypothetical protein